MSGLDGIDPGALDLLADWFDQDDAAKGRVGTQVQEDLRRWAGIVRAAQQPQPAPELGAVLAKVRAIVFRSDTQQARIRDLAELLTPGDVEPRPAPDLALPPRPDWSHG